MYMYMSVQQILCFLTSIFIETWSVIIPYKEYTLLVHSHSRGIVKYVTETMNIITIRNGMEIEETKKKTCTSRSV